MACAEKLTRSRKEKKNAHCIFCYTKIKTKNKLYTARRNSCLAIFLVDYIEVP